MSKQRGVRLGMKISMVLFAAMHCVAGQALADSPTPGVWPVRKKLIQVGHGPYADYVQANIRTMEKRPFDGLVFRLRAAGGRYFWHPAPMDEKDFEQDFENLEKIKWEKFTDNFILVWTAAGEKLDWFDDAQWRAVEHNMALVAKAARLGRCGIALDVENYLESRTKGINNIWSYAVAPHRNSKSFAQYQDMVRRRGRRFIQAVQQELPNVKLFMYLQISVMRNMMGPMTIQERHGKLLTEQYGLVPAFLSGMLEAAGPEVRIIDGNEPAYYYTDRSQYTNAYHLLTERVRMFLDPAVWPEYRTHVSVGQAAYIDQYFGTRVIQTLGNRLSPRDSARWLEHNLYWALYTADEYAWCYGESIDWWWGNKPGTPVWNKGMPPGCVEAIRSARGKIAQGKPLGFVLKPILDKARRQRRAERERNVKLPRAEVRKLGGNAGKLSIDGRLTDVAWQQAGKLTPFVEVNKTVPPDDGKTDAWLTFDDQMLYIAFRCDESRPQEMQIIGNQHDDDVWKGEVIEVLVSTSHEAASFYHFMVNPRGVRWDAKHFPEMDLSYDPEWTSATEVGKNFWSAEVAIPWAALGRTAPRAGETFRANLFRHRPGGRSSTWSPIEKSFLEPDFFGTFVVADGVK